MSEKGVRQCSAGTILFREGEEGQRMYVIQSGRIRLTKRVYDQEVVVEELGAGEFCGELAMLGAGRRPVSAVVVEDASVIQVPADQFEKMIRSNADIAVRMLKRMTQRLTEAQYRVTNLMLRTNTARVLHQLRAEAENQSPELREVAPIPDNLADVLAMEIGEVKKVLAQLVQDELITINKRGGFQIVDLAAYDRYLRYLELQDRFSYL